MTAEEIDRLGFDPSELKSFDPEGRIINEPPTMNRGKWAAGAVGALAAVFTLKVQNCGSDQLGYELFGAANSIVDIPNDSFYSQWMLFRPFTTEQILCLIGQVSITAKADEDIIVPPNMVIWDDRTGNLVYIGGGLFNLAQWATFFTSQAPLTATTVGVGLIISCGQKTYRSLMADLKDLVLYITQTKIIYPDEDGKNNPLTLNRPKSFGGADSNTIEPSSYFEPENQQSKIINIPDRYFVDKLTTIYAAANGSGVNGVPAQPISYTFRVQAFQNNGVLMG